MKAPTKAQARVIHYTKTKNMERTMKAFCGTVVRDAWYYDFTTKKPDVTCKRCLNKLESEDD